MANDKPRLVLLLGGERSGKSALAEEMGRSAGDVVLLATCTPLDEEMLARVEAHRTHRPSTWHVIEEPIRLAEALQPHLSGVKLVIVDCLTLWTSNILLAEEDKEAAEKHAMHELVALLDTYAASDSTFVIVSNEVGMGVVPPYPLGRAYRDLLGKVNQAVAARADEVYLVVAGLPVEIKRLSARQDVL